VVTWLLAPDFGDLFIQSHTLNDLYGKVQQALRRSSFAGADRRSLAQRLVVHDPQRRGFVRLGSLTEELERLGVPLMPHDLGEIRKYVEHVYSAPLTIDLTLSHTQSPVCARVHE
jgi:hypothetical protein